MIVNYLIVVHVSVRTRPSRNFFFPFQQFLSFREELSLKCDVYEKFKVKAETKAFLVITEDKWTYLQQRWNYTSAQTRVWQVCVVMYWNKTAYSSSKHNLSFCCLSTNCIVLAYFSHTFREKKFTGKSLVIFVQLI